MWLGPLIWPRPFLRFYKEKGKMEEQDNSQDSNPELDYNEVCRLIGHLYLQSGRISKEKEREYVVTINALSAQVQRLLAEKEASTQPETSESANNESG